MSIRAMVTDLPTGSGWFFGRLLYGLEPLTLPSPSVTDDAPEHSVSDGRSAKDYVTCRLILRSGGPRCCQRTTGRRHDLCLEQGRDPATLDQMIVAGVQLGGALASRESFVEASGLFAELGCTDLVVVWPRADFPFQGKVELLDEITPVGHSARRGAP